MVVRSNNRLTYIIVCRRLLLNACNTDSLTFKRSPEILLRVRHSSGEEDKNGE